MKKKISLGLQLALINPIQESKSKNSIKKIKQHFIKSFQNSREQQYSKGHFYCQHFYLPIRQVTHAPCAVSRQVLYSMRTWSRPKANALHELEVLLTLKIILSTIQQTGFSIINKFFL
jgi:hypothetical protein